MELTESLVTSTGNQEDSFGGALKTVSTRPCSLILSKPGFDYLTGFPMLTVAWKRASSRGDWHHLLAYQFGKFPGTTSAIPIYYRLISHLLLDELPEDALPEVLQHLADAFVFYQPTKAELPPQQIRPLRGKVTQRYERPTYSLVDEE